MDARADVPLIEKRSGQVVSLTSEALQLMDLESYETFETSLPEEEDLRSKLSSGVEVEFWSIMGRNKIMRIKG